MGCVGVLVTRSRENAQVIPVDDHGCIVTSLPRRVSAGNDTRETPIYTVGAEMEGKHVTLVVGQPLAIGWHALGSTHRVGRL